MRLDYTEPRNLPYERAVPSIRQDAGKLHGLLLRAEVMMTKVDRIRYATRAINAIEDVIRDFTLAYDFEDERLYYLKRMWADIAVFIDLMRTIGEQNCICLHPKHEPWTPDHMKLEIFNAVASLDEGAAKWKNSIMRNKGKTPTIG